MALLDELKKYFSLKDETLTKEEIIQIASNAAASGKPLKITDPVPTVDGVYLPVTVGVYSNGLEKKEGYDTRFILSGGVWTVIEDKMPPTENKIPVWDPEEPGTRVQGDQRIHNGQIWSVDVPSTTEEPGTGTDWAPKIDKVSRAEFEETDSIVIDITESVLTASNNFVDPKKLYSGNWRQDTGGRTPSDNWVSTEKIDIREHQGKQLTISGVYLIQAVQPRFVFFDDSDQIVDVVYGTGKDGTLNFTSETTTIPLGATYVGVNLANEIGIGLPENKIIFNDKTQLEIGEEATDFTPFGFSVKAESVDYPIRATDESISEKLGSVTVESKNFIDMTVDAESGRVNAGDGNPYEGVNWLRTKRKIVPPEMKGKKITVSGVDTMGSSGAVVSIQNEDGDVIFEIVGQGAETPAVHTFTMPTEAYSHAYTIANVIGIGENPLDNEFTHTFQVEIGEEATSPVLGGLMLNGKRVVNFDPPESFDTSEVIMKKNTDKDYSLYFHSGGENNKWIELRFVRVVNVERFIDTWKLNEVFLATRVVSNSFSRGLKVVRNGVWENAIYTGGGGYTDALGSTHGWEILSSATLFMDEKEILLDTENTVWKGRSFSAFQSSDFKTVDGTANAAQSLKEWSLRDGVISVKNRIEWLSALSPGWNSYICMLSILRKSEDGNLSQITHSAIPNDDMVKYDVAEEGFVTPIGLNPGSDPQLTVPDRTKIIIWGDEIKAEVRMKKKAVILSNGDHMPLGHSNSGMYIQNTALYNKVYGHFGSQNVQNGDVWDIENEYLLSYK